MVLNYVPSSTSPVNLYGTPKRSPYISQSSDQMDFNLFSRSFIFSKYNARNDYFFQMEPIQAKKILKSLRLYDDIKCIMIEQTIDIYKIAQMGITTYLGKTLIIASLMFQAYLLFVDRQTIATFDKQLKHNLSSCSCLTPEIQAYVKEYLRLIIGGFIASSALIFPYRCWCFKLPTLIGLILLLWVEQHDVFTKTPNLSILENTSLWHSLGVIGVIVYLLGVQCTICQKDNVKCEVEETKHDIKESKKKK